MRSAKKRRDFAIQLSQRRAVRAAREKDVRRERGSSDRLEQPKRQAG